MDHTGKEIWNLWIPTEWGAALQRHTQLIQFIQLGPLTCACLQNGLKETIYNLNSEIRNLTHFSKSQWWLDLTLLQASESWGSWCLIYVWKNGAGHQSHLSMISKCKEAIQCSCALSMPDFWALLFGREIFKFKVGARSHSRHWIKVPNNGFGESDWEMGLSICLPGCNLAPAWDS